MKNEFLKRCRDLDIKLLQCQMRQASLSYRYYMTADKFLNTNKNNCFWEVKAREQKIKAIELNKHIERVRKSSIN